MIEIIPVIDIKKGRAVRAYKGERDKYKEIGDVFDIFKKYILNKFNKIYIADLDAIMFGFKFGNFDLIKTAANFAPYAYLMIDFGIKNIEEYNTIKKEVETAKIKNISLLVGTETYSDIKFPKDAIISIDAADGEIFGNYNEILKFLKGNTNKFLCIDLKRIGTSNPNIELCKKIYKDIGRKFIYGGGVTSNNISMLEQYCEGVIMGTEIYKKLNLIAHSIFIL